VEQKFASRVQKHSTNPRVNVKLTLIKIEQNLVQMVWRYLELEKSMARSRRQATVDAEINSTPSQ
jgi:hypothetical protein